MVPVVALTAVPVDVRNKQRVFVEVKASRRPILAFLGRFEISPESWNRPFSASTSLTEEAVEQARTLVVHRRQKLSFSVLRPVKICVPREGRGVLIDKVVNILVHIQGVGFDVRPREPTLPVDDALRRIIQRQGKFLRGEGQVDALMVLTCSGTGFGRVLRRHVGAGANH